MCPRFESRWYHSKGRTLVWPFSLLNFGLQILSVNSSLPSWLLVLRNADPDRVLWVHEEACSQDLLREYFMNLENAVACPVVQVPMRGGERLKTWDAVNELLRLFQGHGLTRSSVVVTTGGGAMSDALGFAASIWKRGMRTLHVPTTPLAAVDAAWGGKTGINWGGSKNQMGTFVEPLAVHIDARWMQTLGERDFHAGLAEAAKHALLDNAAMRSFQAPLPVWPCTGVEEHNAWTSWLEASAGVKKRIVELDPHEHGVRTTLNLGHTVAHALEASTATIQCAWLHGEAVALGLHFALHEALNPVMGAGDAMSAEDTEHAQWMGQWLKEWIPLPEGPWPDAASLWTFMTEDKKNVGDEVRDMAWRGVGKVVGPVSWKRDTFEATWETFVRSWNDS